MSVPATLADVSGYLAPVTAFNWVFWAQKLALAVILVLAIIILVRVMTRFFRRMRDKKGPARASLYIVEKLATYGIFILGGLAVLSVLGIRMTSLAVFAGAIGVGVGLGLQGVVKEFVSGLFVIFEPTLDIGDYIETEDGVSGEIMEIGPRASRIRTNDGLNIILPNSRLIENRVSTWTHHGATRRIHIPFGVAYGSDKALVRDVVLKAAAQVSLTLPDTETRKSQVWLTEFGDSALNFELVVWPTADAVRRPGAARAAYNWAIETALTEAGIEIPFPQLDVRFRRSGSESGALELRRPSRRDNDPANSPRPAKAPDDNDAEGDIAASVAEQRARKAPDQAI